jgi:hypothetical protein
LTERRVVRAVNVPTVVRVAFALTLCVWGIAFVGLVALYILGLVSGGLGGVEGFIASLGFTDFRLSILPFLAVFILAAVVASAVVAVAAGVLCFLYNALFPLVGGVELALEERRAPQPRPAHETAPAVRPAVAPRPSSPPASPGLPRPFEVPQRRETEGGGTPRPGS